MRNNLDRFSTPENQQSPAPAADAQQQGGSVFSFAMPTEFVDLPSKGIFYPEGHPLHNVDTVEIRHMTAKDEDILTSESLIRKGIVLDRLLQSVLVDKSIDTNNLLIGDKNALLIACRIYGYGPEYKVEIACPECENKSEYSFDLNEWKEREFNSDGFDVESTGKGTFIIDLPVSDVSVEFGLLTSSELIKVEKLTERSKKLNLPETTATDLLSFMVKSVDGFEDKVSIQNFVNSVPALDSSFLRTVYEAINPDIETSSTFACPACEHQEVVEVPLNASFFWPR